MWSSWITGSRILERFDIFLLHVLKLLGFVWLRSSDSSSALYNNLLQKQINCIFLLFFFSFFFTWQWHGTRIIVGETGVSTMTTSSMFPFKTKVAAINMTFYDQLSIFPSNKEGKWELLRESLEAQRTLISFCGFTRALEKKLWDSCLTSVTGIQW